MSATAVEQEYRAIREAVAVRPVADLAILEVRGERAAASVDRVVAGPVQRLVENRLIWTAILDDDGGVLADVQVYNDFDTYLITCRAGAAAAVLAALDAARAAGVEIEDVSDRHAVLAVEGPDALGIPGELIGPEVEGLSLLSFSRCAIAGGDGILSRVGFTGEFGYQLFVEPDRAGALAELVARAAPGAVPAGGDALELLWLEMRSFNRDRDTPRGESALQAGLHWMIDFRKPAFPGREAVMAEKAAGLERRLVCFVAGAEEPVAGIARGADLLVADEPVGYVANAAWSPGVARTIGLAYVDDAYAWVGLALDAAGHPVRLVSAPFLTTESTRRAAA